MPDSERRSTDSHETNKKIREIARQCAREMVQEHAMNCPAVGEVKSLLRELSQEAKDGRRENQEAHDAMKDQFHKIDVRMVTTEAAIADHSSRISENTQARRMIERSALSTALKILIPLATLLAGLFGGGSIVNALNGQSPEPQPNHVERIAP